MSPLAYLASSDSAFDRLTTWWNGGDLGRPVLQMVAPRLVPREDIPALPKPANWTTHYSTSSYEYRINQSARWCLYEDYFGEAIPNVSPDLGANCLALYLGCQGVDGDDTVWFLPFIKDDEPAAPNFRFDADNFYWQFTLRLATEQIKSRHKYLTAFPDLIEGLDTLAAIRNSQPLLMDLVERPDWVEDCLDQITDLYFVFYDYLYNLIKDERGGSHFWVWAPGRLSKLQCDFSAMISPRMFKRFMLPVLERMTQRLDYSLYHLDGPQAIAHLDALLSLPRLNMIQWQPGAGIEPATHSCWWPLYHKILDAGKKVMPGTLAQAEDLPRLRQEFGRELNNFHLYLSVTNVAEAEKIIEMAQG